MADHAVLTEADVAAAFAEVPNNTRTVVDPDAFLHLQDAFGHTWCAVEDDAHGLMVTANDLLMEELDPVAQDKAKEGLRTGNYATCDTCFEPQ